MLRHGGLPTVRPAVAWRSRIRFGDEAACTRPDRHRTLSCTLIEMAFTSGLVSFPSDAIVAGLRALNSKYGCDGVVAWHVHIP